MGIQVTGNTYTDPTGAVYYRYASEQVAGGQYASGSFRIRTKAGVEEVADPARQAAERSASYLRIPLYEISGYEQTAPPGAVIGGVLASQAAREQAKEAQEGAVQQRREQLMQGYAGTFSDYGQRMASAPIGSYVPTQKEYAQVKYLASPTAQWASAETFRAKAAQVERYAPFAGASEFRGQIVPQYAPPLTSFTTRPSYQYESPFGKGLIKKENFPGMAGYKPETFNVLEGRTMQTYQWTKEASFGKSLFGKPQGAPEIGATYRKSWFGEYSMVNAPKAKLTTKAGLESIKTADILAPMFTTSGVFTSTAALKGASLGINILPKIKGLLPSKNVVSTSGFAGRMSEYTKAPTFGPRTYKTWLKEPSGYTSGSAEAGYKTLEMLPSFERTGATARNVPMERVEFYKDLLRQQSLYSREPPMETRTSLQLIDKRQLGFKGTGGFEITPRETKPAPLGKMMGEYTPSSPYTSKGRQEQALIQLPPTQKTRTEQVKPAFVLKTEQVFSRSKLEDMGAYRSSTAFKTMSMPRTNLFSGLKPSKTALYLSDITYETYKYPPGKRVRQGVHTLYKPIQAMQLSPTTALKPAQMLSYTPVTATATGTSLKTSQRTAQLTSMTMKTMLRNAQVTQQRMITTPRTRPEPFMPRPPPFKLSSSGFTGMKKGKRGSLGYGRFGELAKVAAPKQVLKGFSLGPAKPRRKGKAKRR